MKKDLDIETVRRIAREEAERCVTNRQHKLVRGFGMVPLIGRVTFAQKDGHTEAMVDGHDVAKLLRLTFPEGARVSVLFADARVLEGEDPAEDPPRGTRRSTYEPFSPYADPRRNKETSS